MPIMYTDPNAPNVYYSRPKGPIKPHHVEAKVPIPPDFGFEHKYQYNVKTEKWDEVPLTPEEEHKAGVRKAEQTYHRDAWYMGRVAMWVAEQLWPQMTKEEREYFNSLVPPATRRRIIKSLNMVPHSGVLHDGPEITDPDAPRKLPEPPDREPQERV